MGILDAPASSLAQTSVTGPASAVGTIVKRLPCDTTAGWSTASASLFSDGTNHVTSTQGLMVSGNTGIKQHKARLTGLSLDLSNARQMFWRFYIAANMAANVNVVYIGLVDNNGYAREFNLWTYSYQNFGQAVGGYYWGATSLEETSADSSPSYTAFNFANIVEVYLAFDQQPAGYANAVVTFDDVYFYTPTNTLPAIWIFSDGGNVGVYNVAASALKAGARLHCSINDAYLDVASHLTTSQFSDMLTAGHNAGIYGNNATVSPTLWTVQTDTQKLATIRTGQSTLRKFPTPAPRFLSISGTAGWTPNDDKTLLRRYFSSVTGGSDYAGRQVVRGVADLSHLWISDFVSTTSLLTPTISAAVTGNLWTLGSAQTWTRIHPIKLSTTGALPTTSPQVTAGTVYWLRIASTTTGTLHPTATDAINNTNVITVSATGSGTHTATAYNSATFGLRIASLILSKGLHVEGLHGASAGEVTVAQFLIDVFAAMVNAGEAKFTTTSNLINGTP